MNRLLKRIPTFLQDYREYIKITEAEIPEFDNIGVNYDEIFESQNVFTCSEKYITLYEEMLGLSGEGKTLDERRVQIYIKMNNAIPYNRTNLKNRIYSIIPKEDCDIVIGFNSISIEMRGESSSKRNLVFTLLEEILPLNMIIGTKENEDLNNIKPLYVVSSDIEYVEV